MDLELTDAKYAQSRLRRARKAHPCNAPRKFPNGIVAITWNKAPVPADHHNIQPGEQYVEEFGESLAWESGCRYCAPCAIAAGLATAKTESG